MAEDDKNKVTSLPPPPTDEIDDEWGSSSSPRSERPPAVKASGKSAEKAESKGAKAAPPRDEDEDDEDEEEDDDEDEDDRDDDEEDENDEEDDEEEDDDHARKARARQAAAKRAAAEASQDWLPDWAPWATLGGLLSIGFLGGVGIIPINFNLKPAAAEVPSASAPTPAPTSSAPKRAPSARRPPPPAPGAQGAADQERVSASHLLVSYKGALRAAGTVTRTKEEAKKRAQEALAKAKKGEKFEKLVADYSDEPGAAARGGKLGTFPRQAMVKPFADAAFALKPGQLSDVVETDFGYHVILRTQ